MRKKKINVVTLGCSKNLVDSEYLMSQLTGNGFEVIHDSNDESAKTVVINTCGFIDEAREESVETILSFARAKEAGIIDHLFVFGCLAQRYKKDLIAEIPEVDAFFGVKNLKDVVQAIGGLYKEDLVGERFITTPKHYAYLKIAEGCNWACSYCAIPLIRGKHVSLSIDALYQQSKKLAEKGVKELIIIAQDTTFYGMDLYGKRCIAELLHKLSTIDGIEWIRLHYAYPTQFPEELIEEMRTNPKICKYIDIPFQHISDQVLKNMRRGINKQQTYDLINKLKNEIPGIAIRTTLLVGHPGETIEAFEELKEFVSQVKFDRLGVFPYSEEENTYAAQNFKDLITNAEKQKRSDEIMSLQNKISAANNAARVGQVYKVMVDRQEGAYFIGRTEFDSPEIDQEVLIVHSNLQIGNFVTVKVTESDDYDLYGAVVDSLNP